MSVCRHYKVYAQWKTYIAGADTRIVIRVIPHVVYHVPCIGRSHKIMRRIPTLKEVVVVGVIISCLVELLKLTENS